MIELRQKEKEHRSSIECINVTKKFIISLKDVMDFFCGILNSRFMDILQKINNLSSKTIIIILIVVGFIVYGNTFVNEMLWDEHDLIINNEYIRDWKYFPKYFSENLIAGSGIVSNYWRPLLLISFFIDYKIGGLEPFVYNLQNMSWHILSSVLFFVLLRRLSLSISVSLLSSLLFLVHPVQTEAITYISGRSDPMHMTFIFAGLIYFIKSMELQFNKKYYIFSIALFILALLTRECSIIFPALLLGYVFILHNKENITSLKNKILIVSPLIIISIIYFLLRISIIHFDSEFLISDSLDEELSM